MVDTLFIYAFISLSIISDITKIFDKRLDFAFFFFFLFNSPFREGCEELRTKLFSIHQKKVCEERKAQIEFNKEQKRQKLVEEQMFSRLWEEDRLAKEKREAQEERRRKELVENTRLGLNAQVTSILAQKQAEQLQKEEEAHLLVSVPECPQQGAGLALQCPTVCTLSLRPGWLVHRAHFHSRTPIAG